MLVALARELSGLNCRAVIAVFQDSRFDHTEVADEALRSGLEVELVPCRGRCDLNAVRRIRSLMAKHNVDVLHPHGYKADFYSYAAAFPNRAALFATSHNWPNKLLHMRAYAAIDRFILKRFDYVVVVSPIVREILRRSGISPDRLGEIPNGVDVNRFYGARPTLKNELHTAANCFIGFVGRLVPGKGVSVLLRAAQHVLREHRDVTFLIVGDGPARRELEQLAASLEINTRVIFTGNRNDMPGVYASLDIVVLPSLEEAMPMCLIEAMATGKPVIATRVGAVPDVVADEITGLMVEPGNVMALANAMKRLLNDQSFARELGVRGHARAAERFSVQQTALQYLTLYEDMLNSRNARMLEAETVN